MTLTKREQEELAGHSPPRWRRWLKIAAEVGGALGIVGTLTVVAQAAGWI